MTQRIVIENCAVATVDADDTEYASGHVVVADDVIESVGAGKAPEGLENVSRRIDTRAVEFVAGFAWISEEELRACAPLAADPTWQSGVSAMIVYARTRGWVDSTTGRIRAHIEHQD